MILISAGLVLAAVVLLIAGFVMAEPFLIMWSIVVSVLSALFLVIGAFLRRHELFPGGGGAGARTPQANAPTVTPTAVTPAGAATAPTMPQQQPRPLAPAQPVPSGMRPQQGVVHGAPPRPAPAVAGMPRGISPEALVLVIPGRKRYHVAGCRQLSGRDHEELTFEEAREEGFTPCTTCLPDAALGGRQVPSAAEPRQAQPAGRAPYAAPSPRDTPPAGRPPVSAPPAASAGPQAAHGAEAASKTDPRPPAGVSGKPPATPADEGAKTEATKTDGGKPATKTDGGKPGAHPEGAKPGARPEGTKPATTAGARPDGAKSGEKPEDAKAADARTGGKPVQPGGKPEASSAPKRPEPAQAAGRPEASAAAKTATAKTAAAEEVPQAKGERPESAPAAAEVDEGDTAPGGLPLPPSTPGRLVAGTPGGSTVPNLDRPTPPTSKGGDAPAKKQAKGAAPEENAATQETQRLRPPVDVTPVSDSKASTSGQEPEAERPSGGARPAESGRGWFDRPESPAEKPVEPEATAPGRAGPPVASGPTTPSSGKAGEPAARKGEPANETVRLDRPGIVKVIGGTRRFHNSSCPLVRAAEASGVRSMPQAEAEAKGLTPCSVCMHEHQTVG
ncbi:hypothetical protein AB0B45_00915 [Nonomuraea sp. NPDC049152]|uniref:hypothetical protein n=1 Tax=Nonomuraea sp. NPDC049152 TaxID=3154350 RepID=UPI003403378A